MFLTLIIESSLDVVSPPWEGQDMCLQIVNILLIAMHRSNCRIPTSHRTLFYIAMAGGLQLGVHSFTKWIQSNL